MESYEYVSKTLVPKPYVMVMPIACSATSMVPGLANLLDLSSPPSYMRKGEVLVPAKKFLLRAMP